MRRGVFVCAIIALTLLAAGCLAQVDQIPLSDDQASAALSVALSKVGAPYVLGGRGPDSFDCSGLITWAYKQVVPGMRFSIGGGRTAEDANMAELFRYNYRPLPATELTPGDLVFLSDGRADVTHGGLVVSVTAEAIRFLNASSYHKAVAEEEWPLVGEKRGQRIVGYGRLLLSL
ncbi:MAG: C40 family peptidase [Betaproteobacteria bacterium]